VRLGIDLDGVVANFTEGWVTRYNEDFGASLSPEDVTTWGAMTEIAHFADMEEFWSWAAASSRPTIFRHLPLYPGALDAIKRLSARHDIVIVTAKPNARADEDTRAWIADVGLPASEVHITEEKWRIDCDVYLDDAPHQLRELTLHRPDRVVCRFVRPWNQPYPGTRDVRDWDEFVSLVDQVWC